MNTTLKQTPMLWTISQFFIVQRIASLLSFFSVEILNRTRKPVWLNRRKIFLKNMCFLDFFISKLIAFSCLTYFRVAWQFSSVKSGTLCRSPLPTKTTSRRRIRGRMARHSWFKDCWVLRKTEPLRFVDHSVMYGQVTKLVSKWRPP